MTNEQPRLDLNEEFELQQLRRQIKQKKDGRITSHNYDIYCSGCIHNDFCWCVVKNEDCWRAIRNICEYASNKNDEIKGLWQSCMYCFYYRQISVKMMLGSWEMREFECMADSIDYILVRNTIIPNSMRIIKKRYSFRPKMAKKFVKRGYCCAFLSLRNVGNILQQFAWIEKVPQEFKDFIQIGLRNNPNIRFDINRWGIKYVSKVTDKEIIEKWLVL